MKQKHTPAPWSALIDNERKYFQIETDMDAICTNGSCYEPFNPANAHLLAAAPELLEALEGLRSELFYHLAAKHGEKKASKHFEIVKADAAIAKARGEL